MPTPPDRDTNPGNNIDVSLKTIYMDIRSMLLRDYEKALHAPDNDYHLAFELERIFEVLHDGNELSSDLKGEAEELGEFQLHELLTAMESWYVEDEFDSIQDILDLLDDQIDAAIDLDWYAVTATFHIEKIQLKAGLSGHDPQPEIADALTFLDDNLEETSTNRIQSLVKLVLDNADFLTDDELRAWADLCDRWADLLGDENQYMQERHAISHRIALKNEISEDVNDDQQRMVDSFDKEAELKGQNSSLLLATTLEQGLKRCVEFLSDEKKKEWKRRALDARREGINEMAEISIDEDMQEALAEESRANIERMVDWVKDTVDIYSNSTYALYCLLCSDGYVPGYEQALLVQEGFVFPQMVQTQITSPEGHSIGVNPSLMDDPESRRIPTSYVHDVRIKNIILTSALYRLFDDDIISEFDFYLLFEVSDMSDNTKAFLTDAVMDLYDGKYIRSFGLAIHRMEGAIVDTLDEMGMAFSALTGEGTQQQALGGLLEDLDDLIDEEYLIYLITNYTDGRGHNYRNRWAHGQMQYRELGFQVASITIFDTLKTVLQMNPTPFVAQFSLPSRTISKRTQEGLDVGEFLEEDHEIIAYGYEDKIGVIVAENPDANETNFRVVRGGTFQDYPISGVDQDRDEIERHLESLKIPAPNLPDAIELVWVETDEEIQSHLLQIVRTLNEHPAEEGNLERVKEAAHQYGIDPEMAESMLDAMLTDGELSRQDGVYSVANINREK